jgi:hypothetical protein
MINLWYKKQSIFNCNSMNAGILVVLLCTLAWSTDYPQNIGPINLTDEMWQLLPEDVREVFVAPDDRIWYLLNHPATREDLPLVYQIIEQQFTEEAPQLYGARPVLFEPNGRVWFVTHSRTILIGYDGSEWIEQSLPDEQRFTGTCYNHGNLYWSYNSHNVQFHTDLFFPDSYGVHWFNGLQWNYKRLLTDRKKLILRPDPVTQRLWVCIDGSPNEAWQWHDNQWTQMIFAADIEDVLPAPGGIWLLKTGGQIEYQAVDPNYSEDLDYSFSESSLLHCDPNDGRCYLHVKDAVRGSTSLGDGLLMLNGPNDPTFLPGLDMVEGWYSHWAEDSGPAFNIGKDQVWVSARDMEGTSPYCIDLASGEIIAQFPDESFHWFHGTRSDGTVFASTREPGQIGCALAAYRPEMEDARHILTCSSLAIENSCSGFAIDSKGAIWAQRQDQSLARFHKEKWYQIAGVPASADIRMLVPGSEGRMIIQTNDNCYYWKGGPSAVSYYTLRKLVTKNYNDISSHYTHWPRESTTFGTFVMGLVADQAGYVWLLESRRLSVLINGSWKSGEMPLRNAGSEDGEVEYLNRIGESGSVYVSDFNLRHDGGISFYGSVENNKLVFTEAPHSIDSRETRLAIRDANDALWVAGSLGYGASTSDVITGQLALRIENAQNVQEFENSGWAYLCDLANNVWLAQIRGQADNMFYILRAGIIVGSVQIPNATSYKDTLFSDKAGSVYAWTVAGLYHLIASKESDFTDYQVDRLYSIEGLFGNVEQLAYSSQGYLAIVTYSDAVPRQYHLHLIPLPSDTPDKPIGAP